MNFNFSGGNGRVVLRGAERVNWILRLLAVVRLLGLGLPVDGLELGLVLALPTHGLLVLDFRPNWLLDVVVVTRLQRGAHVVLVPHYHLFV